MSDIYKLQYNGMTLAYPGWNGYVSYESAPAFKTLTLCASNGGTLTADTITGFPGDTIELAPTYDTYWRFSGYAKAGDGTLSTNTYTFGEDDEQIVSAYFKKNTFTAKGNFDKGSNVTAAVTGNSGVTKYVSQYAKHTAHTGDIPAVWYSNSNTWNPTNASSYSITSNTYMKFSARNNYDANTQHAVTAVTVIGDTQYQSKTYNVHNGRTSAYSVTVTTTAQSSCCASAQLYAHGNISYNSMPTYSRVIYLASGTTGSWTATGYAP